MRAHNHLSPNTKSNPNSNPNPAAKLHAIVSIQLNVYLSIVICPEKHKNTIWQSHTADRTVKSY